MINVILLGPPGVGKGTQSTRLATHFGLTHISTGDLLRQQMEDQTSLGISIKELMDSGQYVGDDIVCELVEDAIDPTRGIVLDGFPRTIVQAEILNKILAQQGRTLTQVFELQAETNTLIQRMLARAVNSGRADDTEEVFAERLQTYAEKTEPLIQYYRAKGILTSIDSLDEIGTVANRIRRELE